jgi:hypothetical protein
LLSNFAPKIAPLGFAQKLMDKQLFDPKRLTKLFFVGQILVTFPQISLLSTPRVLPVRHPSRFEVSMMLLTNLPSKSDSE